MPTLNWLGDDKAKQTARHVPYRLLETVSQHSDAESGNLLIQGDNLEALKALLPFYAGQVKCIFIDPPYNTKSAFEHYDDNLEHSQWLSMMYPRLELLRDLLSEDGSIWITIDDNEAHYLKVLLDEIFGRKNFIANAIWKKKYAAANDHKTIAPMHDHILIYSKSNIWKRNLLPRTEEKNKQYRFSDENGNFRPDNYTCGKSSDERPNLYYPIQQPNTGEEIWPKKTAVWRYSQDEHKRHITENLIYWGKDGVGKVPAFKRYLHMLKNDGVIPETVWGHEFVGHTDGARKEAREVLNTKDLSDDFLTPKPEKLIERILHIASSKNDLIIDSFLGSGTTAAVAHKMSRRWIGIEMGDHAQTHCIPRLEKVIEGEQGGISKAVNWTGGGGFRFMKLGEPAFMDDGRINPAVRFATLAAYLWFLDTKSPHATGQFTSPIIGTVGEEDTQIAYALLYNGILGDRRPNGGNVLTSQVWDYLKSLLPEHNGRWVIYGEASRMPEARRKAQNIEFRQIPYEIRLR